MNFARPNTSNIERMSEFPAPAERTVTPGGSGSYNRIDDALDINWLFSSFLARMKLVIGAVVVALALALLYLSVATPRYESTAQLLIESNQPKITQGEEVAPGLDTSRFMIGQVIDSQIELLRSRRLAEEVIHRLDLRDFETPKPGLVQRLIGEVFGGGDAKAENSPPDAVAPAENEQEPDGGDEPKPRREISEAELGRFLSGLDVRRFGLSLIIQVKYVHEDPKKAAEIANAVARTYIEGQEERRLERATKVKDWLKDRVLQLQERIGDRRRTIERYKASNELVDSGGQLLQERELSETMAQSITANANAAALLAELRKVEQSASTDSPATATRLSLQSTVISDFKRQYAQVQRQVANTVSRYGVTHPQVVSLKAELAKIEREITLESQRLVENLRNQYEIARSKSQLLDQKLHELMEKLSESRERRIKLAEMERDVAVDSQLYSSLLARLREIELQRSLTRSVASIVEGARPAERAAHPRKLLVLIGSLATALVLSGSAALLLEFFGNFLRSPSSVRRVFGFKHVIPLPPTRKGGGWWKLGFKRSGSLENQAGPKYVQSLFLLRELIMADRANHGAGLAVVMVSALRGEGKTTTAVNLARYAADSGLNTVVLDCDVHEAGATRALLRAQPERFLDDYFRSEDPDLILDETLIELGTGVKLIAARPLPPPMRSMDVMVSQRMGQLIQSLRSRFDLIIIDTPALNDYVDAPGVATHSDALLLVIEANRARVDDVSQGLETLEEEAVKIDGVVFNKYAT
jgi:uncharacterized protein involved in exopolysaccharide biosynthesis/Mrp family chromosome partitioning ATPase